MPLGILGSLFQFHKGSINTLLSIVIFTRSLCFNSIKVRLILYAINSNVSVSRFQFHKGSINTRVKP